MNNLLHQSAVIIFLLFAFVASAQKIPTERESVTLFKQALELFEKEKYREAIPIAERAQQLAEKEFGKVDSTYAEILNLLGQLHDEEAHYKEAESYYLEALALRRKLFTGNHPQLASSLNNIGYLYTGSGRYSEAEAFYLEALKMRRSLYKTDHINLAFSVNNLALLYDEIGRFTEAEPLYKESLAIRRRLFPGDNNKVQVAIGNLALFYLERGRLKEAEPLMEESTAMSTRLYNDQPSLITPYNNVAYFYLLFNLPEKAEYYAIKSLDLCKSLLPKTHPIYAQTMLNVAVLYSQLKRFSEAEVMYKESLTIFKQLYQNDHQRLAWSLRKTGDFYDANGKSSQADSLYQEALSMAKRLGQKAPPELLPDILFSRAYLLHKTGRHDYAGVLFDEALTLSKLVYNSHHPKLAAVFKDCAKFYDSRGQYDKAESLYEKNLDIVFNIIEEYFPSLSEYEKGKYWEKMHYGLNIYNSFALRRAKQNPSITERMYNNQLIAKGLLLSAGTKMRERIMQSADSTVLADYKRWQAEREVLAHYLNFNKVQLRRRNINLDSLQNTTNLLEKSLYKRSAAFAAAFDTASQPRWQDIRNVLQPGEAAIEIVQFPFYENLPNKHDSLVKFLQSGDSIMYAALIVSPHSKDFPDIVVLSNGADLEGRLMNIYQQRVRRKTTFELELDPDYGSYIAFWKPIADALRLKNVHRAFVSPDGAYHKININTLLNPSTKKYVIDEIDVRLLTSTRDLLSRRLLQKNMTALSGKAITSGISKKTKQSKLQNKSTLPAIPQTPRVAELFGFPLYTIPDTLYKEKFPAISLAGGAQKQNNYEVV